MKEIIILFTRVPKEGSTKTRLYDFLNPKQAVILQEKLLQELYNHLKSWNFEVKVFHNGNENDDNYMKNLLSTNDSFYYQVGDTLGDKMKNALAEVLKENENAKVLLMGSDIVGVTKENIDKCFDELNKVDVVVNPTYDGGYYLIGMNRLLDNIFNISQYGVDSVFENTIKNIEQSGYSYFIGDKCLDIDTKEDLLTYVTNLNNINLLGSGEYNINFLYDYTKDEKRILRLNMKSQMNLSRQIKYEYETLKMLENSGVTPKVYEINEDKYLIPYDYLTMEYLDGRVLNYNTDMDIAAYLLSTIHNTSFENNGKLIEAKDPFTLMYEECSMMAGEYLSWDKADIEVKNYIRKFLNICEDLLSKSLSVGNFCIINTELNSGNFIIGQDKYSSYVIDWEKALIGECEQDLAHFLAPTTTFWKTDKILNTNEINEFLNEYSKYKSFNKEKFDKYLIFTCLRGVTWCSMAYRQYSENSKMLKDEFTFNKIKSYLDYDFLANIERYFN